jgi:hypothetical protein
MFGNEKSTLELRIASLLSSHSSSSFPSHTQALSLTLSRSFTVFLFVPFAYNILTILPVYVTPFFGCVKAKAERMMPTFLV